MAIAFVSTTAGVDDDSGTSLDCTAASHTTGNLIVVGVKWEGAATTLTASDTAGNTYAAIAGTAISNNNADLHSQILYAFNVTGNANNVVQVQFAAGRPFRRVLVCEYSGVAATSPFDQAATGHDGGGAGTTLTSGDITTTQDDEVLVAIGSNYSGSSMTQGANYTERNDQTGAMIEDRIVSATGTYNATMTVASANWIIALASFKADTGGGGFVPYPRPRGMSGGMDGMSGGMN